MIFFLLRAKNNDKELRFRDVCTVLYLYNVFHKGHTYKEYVRVANVENYRHDK